MRYLISMSDVEDEWDGLSEEEQERIGARHAQFQRELGDRYIGRYGAHPSREAKTVRLHADGKFTVADGLMTQTKEPMGGFYIIEAGSLEEAVAWAKRGRFRPGPNEVRELRED